MKLNNEDFIIENLVFEITRKCNLNCKHCMKGNSQNVTISSEIINKTLDVLEKNKIHRIRLFGGEPTLEPKIIQYIVKEIIKRNIDISRFEIQTNGYFCDIEISNALNEIGKYIKSTNSDLCDNAYMEISLSDHINNDIAKKGYEFYKKTTNENVLVLLQDERQRNEEIESNTKKEKVYIYMGNAMDNFHELKEKCTFRIKDTKNSLRNPASNIIDNIYVCANGNVVNCVTSSYLKEDNPECYICNILTDDLFEKIEEWNFKYPLSKQQRRYREFALTYLFNNNNKLNLLNNSIHYNFSEVKHKLGEITTMLDNINLIEQLKRECHNELQYVDYDEFGELSDVYVAIKTDGWYLNSALNENKEICNYDKETCLNILNKWREINYFRATGDYYVFGIKEKIKESQYIVKKYIRNNNKPKLDEINKLIDTVNKLDYYYKELCKIDNVNSNAFREKISTVIEQNRTVSNHLVRRVFEKV